MSTELGGDEVPTLEQARVLSSLGNALMPELLLSKAESRLLASQFRNQPHRNLRELYLNGLGRSFGDDGLRILSEALLSCHEPSQLRVLQLRTAGISNMGLITLSRVLAPKGRGDIAPLKYLRSLHLHDHDDIDFDGVFPIVAAAVQHIRRWNVRPEFHLDLRPGREAQKQFDYDFMVQRALWWAGSEKRLNCLYSWLDASPESLSPWGLNY